MVKVTMKDIAQVCGVSVMTVSNAFNRPDQLSADLRARILTRADKMGYTGPDATARNLRSGRTNTYGVVFDEPLSYAFNDPFTVEWLAGFSAVMERTHASVQLLSVPATDPASLDVIRSASIDGLAGVCASNPAIDLARRRGIPVVTTTESPEGDEVTIDDAAAGGEVAGHVLRLGHRRVTLLVETLDPTCATPSESGMAGFQAELERRHGAGFYDSWRRLRGLIGALASCDARVVRAGLNSRTSGFACGPLLFDRLDRSTAVVAVSDVLALGAMDAMAERGLVPGRDVSVTGFDDLPRVSAAAGLTTIRQPIRRKGQLAAELLLDPARQPRRIRLEHELVVRRSTGPAPAS